MIVIWRLNEAIINRELNMKKTLITLATLLSLALVAEAAIAECTDPSDRASDGSRCGGRASSVRPGGK